MVIRYILFLFVLLLNAFCFSSENSLIEEKLNSKAASFYDVLQKSSINSDGYEKNIIDSNNLKYSCLKNSLESESTLEEKEQTRANLRGIGFNYMSLLRFFFDERESAIYDFGESKLENGMIVFVNGVLTEATDAQEHAEYLSKLSGNKNIHYVHKPTHGVILDVLESMLGRGDLSQQPVELIQQIWGEFFYKDKENSILMICHSMGANIVKNALLEMRPEIRKRIIVVSIAGADIIPESLCRKSYNYISTMDFIPLFDFQAWDTKLEEIYYIHPENGADMWDHAFQSPTYTNILKYHIDKYIDNPKGD